MTHKFFDAGQTPGNPTTELTTALHAAIAAEGLDPSAIAATAIDGAAGRNDFLLAVACGPSESLRLTLRLATRLGPGGPGPLRAQLITREQLSGEPVTLLVFLDAGLTVRLDH